MSQITPSIQDFSLINSYVTKIKEDLEFDTLSNAFYFFVMDYILELNEDEIKDSITDTNFLKTNHQLGGHDRGIDAIYIDDSESTITVHFFNFKYTSKFEKTKNHYPSVEIDKILSFVKSLMSKDEYLNEDVNPILYSKCKEIWKIFETQNPNFVLHICGNFYKIFEPNEEKRFQREIEKYSNFDVQYHLLPELIDLVTSSTKKEINAKIMGIDQRYFEKTGGNVRALIFEIDAKDLIRIVLDNEDIRNATDL
ncbi:hypothetical protein [Crocosphaera chwakensis]|uniref:Uncharacterized protein n=1 Tax=Crocosphaera chwakensis CCY0110 TaxID=391612 RepID=A3IR27_9CHRO|nr:hypothetical protein [Crocosphaera chwakensis]EAZ91017.1 hypothetical protein CY0110_27435 [Crocosphaera chwakensis CCY0110]